MNIEIEADKVEVKPSISKGDCTAVIEISDYDNFFGMLIEKFGRQNLIDQIADEETAATFLRENGYQVKFGGDNE